MGQSVEVLAADGGEILKPHAAITRLGVWRPAIYGHLMSARRQAGRKFFGESLESAVVGWYAGRAEESDAHRRAGHALPLRLRRGGARKHANHLLGRLLGHRRVLEPARHVLVVHPPAD